MLYQIAVNQSKTEAYIYYMNGRTIKVSHSEGKVLDLIADILKPMGSQVETITQLMVSQDDTQVIDLNKVS